MPFLCSLLLILFCVRNYERFCKTLMAIAYLSYHLSNKECKRDFKRVYGTLEKNNEVGTMKEPFSKKEDQYLILENWAKLDPRLIAGVTTKNGGVSIGDFQQLNTAFHVNDAESVVVENREILSKKLEIPLTDWVGAEQTHETHIEKITSLHRGAGSSDYESALKATDGMYTDKRQLLLTLCFADCVPLYFYAPMGGMIGTAHAGWKGTVAGIGSKMVGLWKKEGIDPKQIYAVIGPSICRKCYVVDDKVINLVQKLLEETDEKPYNLISEGQYQLDLKQLNAQILEKSGVPKNNIEISALCTSCESDLFFSHRRDSGKTGRILSFIGWKED